VTARRWFAALGAISVAALIAALISQHVFDMQPCPWCVLQRLVFAVIALACVLGLAWRSKAGRLASAALVLLLADAGAAAALWQHFVAAKSPSCDLTLADRIVSGASLDKLLPDVFAVRGSCAEAAVDLLGMPYELWSLALFVVIGAAAVVLLVQHRKD
jgi:protein dithiol:quinone oxidoreductase